MKSFTQQQSPHPFQCPICHREYNDDQQIPTTLPCGHSCCLFHLQDGTIRHCIVCHSSTPPYESCAINVSLRDGAILYYRTIRSHDRYDDSERRDTDETTTTNTRRSRGAGGGGRFMSSIWCSFRGFPWSCSSSSSSTNATTTTATASAAAAARRRRERYQEPKTVVAARPSPIEVTAIEPPMENPTIDRLPWQEKACGHCCSPSSLKSCCACMDRRPIQERYPVYVDGTGWRDIAKRADGYCPICRYNNAHL